MPQEILLTKEGYEKKRKQLEELEHKLYHEIPQRLKEAKERGGDLLENREYVYLKNEQEIIEREVRRLRELLENARIISEDEIKGDTVGIGTRVILEDTETGEFDTYTLVSPAEVDLLAKRIGIDSPVGAALMGHTRGDIIVVQTPSGKRRFRILGVEK